MQFFGQTLPEGTPEDRAYLPFMPWEEHPWGLTGGVTTTDLHKLTDFFLALPALVDERPFAGVAVSIPFATLPLNMYMRVPERVKDYPLVLPAMMDAASSPDRGRIGKYLGCLYGWLWQTLRRGLPGEDVSQLNALSPGSPHTDVRASRVTTARFVHDAEQLTPQLLAYSLWLGAIGMRSEFMSRIRTTLAGYAQGPHPSSPRTVIQYKRPRVYVKRDAFMFEWFAATTWVGFVYDGRDHQTHRISPRPL